MLSSLNAFSGLSAADVLTLFGTNSSSSSSSSTSASAAPSPPTGASPSSANDPASSIKAILAEAQIGQTQIGTLGGGSGSLLSASVTIVSPGAAQQIDEAVSLINNLPIYAQIGDVSSPITVTAADAINVTIGDGAIGMTAIQGAALPSGLPSLTSIEQAYNRLQAQDQFVGFAGAFDGNFTLVKLPPGTLGANGGNIATFSATGDDNNKWALVLPQDTVNVTVSDTEVKG